MKQAPASLRRGLAKLENQIDGKLDQIVECSSLITLHAFERKVEKLERDKLLIEEKLTQKTRPQAQLRANVRTRHELARKPLESPASPRIEDKRTVLKLAFSERLAYCRKSGF